MMRILAETMWTELLFENPWPAVVGLLAVSAVLRTVGKRQEQSAMVIVSWVALVLSLGVFGLAAWVNTDREVMIEQTQALVAATSPVNEAELDRLLADNALLLGPEGQSWESLDAAFIAERLERFDVKDTSAKQVDAASRRPGYGVSTMSVSSRVGGYPAPTTWEIQWRKTPSGVWEITSMQWLTLYQKTPTRSDYR